MGKVRIPTIGDPTIEKDQKEKAEKRKEAKVAKENLTKELHTSKDSPIQKEVILVKQKKQSKNTSSNKIIRSKKYETKQNLVDTNTLYSLDEALDLLDKVHLAAFDETVELHINTIETGISGSVVLPYGTGKKIRIAILSPNKDPQGADQLLKDIDAGKITFDILIATPDAMARLAKVARTLGPRGLMPNPKNGTITNNPEEIAKKFEAGQISFKTEAKNPLMHVSVGKISFSKDKLKKNIDTLLSAIQLKNIKKMVIKTTMSLGIKIDLTK